MSPEFKPGDIVRIKYGALAGLKGVVVDPAVLPSELNVSHLSDAILLEVEMNGSVGGRRSRPVSRARLATCHAVFGNG